MVLFKDIKNVGKRFLQHINLTNAKRLFNTTNDLLGLVDRVGSELKGKNDVVDKILGSDSFKKTRQGVRIADNILNRGSALTDKETEFPVGKATPKKSLSPEDEMTIAEGIVNDVKPKRIRQPKSRRATIG